MSRMFKSITRTWNVFVGCEFNCTYCNARKLALTRLKHLERYKDGFKPHLVESELNRTFKPGEFVFVAYMGDIAFCPAGDMSRIIARTVHFPKTDFLFMSKDPRCFKGWLLDLLPNVVLGTTLESNIVYPFSKAPTPYERTLALGKNRYPRKMVSIEPVMDFNLNGFIQYIGYIKPEIIEVGADNYHNNLPEPSPEKLEQLLTALRDICPRVIEKDGLDRLLKAPGEPGRKE